MNFYLCVFQVVLSYTICVFCADVGPVLFRYSPPDTGDTDMDPER